MDRAFEHIDNLRIQIKDKFPQLIESQKNLTNEMTIFNKLKMVELELQLGTIDKETAKKTLEEIKNQYYKENSKKFFR